MNAISIKGLTKIYAGRGGVKISNALNNLNIEVDLGEFVGVMGPSGSGKTTLLNLISGIDEPTSGYIEVLGKNLSNMNKEARSEFRRKELGLIFQDYNLIENLTLEENAALPLIMENKDKDYIRKRVYELMELFNVKDIKEKFIYNVSGGEAQRAAACRALITNPYIVLADEPTGNLDSHSSNKFMKYMEKINEEKGTTIFMVTHDSFAASFCKRIIFIKDGRIYAEILRKEEQKKFYNRILDTLAVIGGEINEF